MDFPVFSGFEWDDGNWPKCGKHGVSRRQIEEVFTNEPGIFPDARHSTIETRWLAIGRAHDARWIFIAFTIRKKEEGVFIRPISARFMHEKEVRHYERQRRKAEEDPEA